MAQKIKLKFDTEYFPLTKGSYNLTLQNKETVNETEAGTLIRDIKRLGVPHLSISSTIDSTWLQKLQGYYTKGSAVKVYYFSPSTLAEDNYDGFIQNLSFNLLKDNGTTTYWDVTFEVTAY
jgi:hypothetical protein